MFATTDGWMAALGDELQRFDTRGEAMAAALKLAQVTRWRGDAAEVISQDHAGGVLTAVETVRGPELRR
ncbi:MAG TPA: hypothetical protein VGG29_08000 [Caulobacteraceae bacterium]